MDAEDRTELERYEPRINRAIGLIDAHIDRDLSLEALADAACLSPYHFHRIFSAMTGETVHCFTTRLRLERALRLARTRPAESWKAIAGRVGYRSVPVFSRAFKRVYGVSPSAFDLEAYWTTRPDRDQAHAVSAYFLRPALPIPSDFVVELKHRPHSSLIVSGARGGYVDPTVLVDAYERLCDWARLVDLPVGGGRLSGSSCDDPEMTPLSRCRYRFALEVSDTVRPSQHLTLCHRSRGWWAIHHVTGDLKAVDRAWALLFKSWLPASGLRLRNEPAEEVFLQTPAEIGWEKFDLLCCVPIQHSEVHQ